MNHGWTPAIEHDGKCFVGIDPHRQRAVIVRRCGPVSCSPRCGSSNNPDWITPPATAQLREPVRDRADLVALRSGLTAEVHAVLPKPVRLIAVSDLCRYPSITCGRRGPALPSNFRLSPSPSAKAHTQPAPLIFRHPHADASAWPASRWFANAADAA